MRLLTSGSCNGWPVVLSTNIAKGEPQARWRLISQSGRPSTIDRMRLRPPAGKKSVASMASSAVSRRVRPLWAGSSRGSSMRMNHWGVLRKITGALERQECG